MGVLYGLAPSSIQRAVASLLSFSLALGVVGWQVSDPAVAADTFAAGPQGLIKITFTVPEVPTTYQDRNVGTASGEYQVLMFNIQLVKKTAAPTPPATSDVVWLSSEAQKFTTAADGSLYCIGATTCTNSGLFKLEVSRGGSPVVYTPSYFAEINTTYQINVGLASTSAPAVGTVGLQKDDVVSLTLKDGLVNIPTDFADYEFRVTYEMVLIDNGAHGRFAVGPTSLDKVALVIPAAPTAVARAGAARVTPAVVSPEPAKFIITASPEVGGVTRTCTVTPPATFCDVSGLTPGVAYTFTTQVFPLNDIPSGSSLASDPVTPFVAPTVTGVSPVTGPLVGGQLITVTGTNFESGATVSVGGTACVDVTVVSATEITCRTGAKAAGTHWVNVLNSNGGSGTKFSAYTYSVQEVNTDPPSSGPGTGQSQRKAEASTSVAQTTDGGSLASTGVSLREGALDMGGSALLTVLGLLLLVYSIRARRGISLNRPGPGGGSDSSEV